MMVRRELLGVAFAGAISLLNAGLYAGYTNRKKLLLRSSWQTVNIGDIAHTPGVLALIEKKLPDTDCWLWPSNLENGVQELLLRRFPQLKIVQGAEDIKSAMRECDFLLHGSGASFVAFKDTLKWYQETHKPFGIWGITSNDEKPEVTELMNQAKFVFFRDSVSLKTAQEAGVIRTITGFGPDGAFNTDLKNEAAARKFLSMNNLEEGKYICCIPRLRYTPYWKIKKGRAYEEYKDLRNQEMDEHDHAPLRNAIAEIVNRTDKKVLLCSEDSSQMEVGKEHIYDKLPDKIKQRVVWKQDYWLTDEALSTYKLSSGLFGLEMHSPIMCIGNDVPAIVCRFKEQTTKGFMWEDIGLKDWLFDMDQPEQVKKLSGTVLEMITNQEESLKKTLAAKKVVLETQDKNIEVLRGCL